MSGALTAVSTLLVTGAAAIVGVIIARKFGRTEETDGFFAAYGVFIVIVLAAQAIRIAIIPTLARARDDNRLAGEVAGYGVALAAVAVPLVLATELFATQIADVLTGDGTVVSQGAAADALRWMVPAAAVHLYAGLAASGLAALNDYVTAACGYAAGSAVGLAFILTRVEPDGMIAVAWGMTLNAVIAFAVPCTGLVVRALRTRMPRHAVRPAGQPIGHRLVSFAAAAALPIALQMLYVVCLPFAGRLGTGAVTSFGYAYLASAGFVTVTAFSLGLVTSAPLFRAGLDAERTTRHVVAVAWLALVLIGAGMGVFAIVGADVVEAVLGDAFRGDVGADVARLVVVLSPWIVASVGVNTAFPLIFVVDRTRLLPAIAAAALALQVLIAWVAVEIAELDGLALGLALSTFLVLAALLHELGALRSAAHGLVVATGVVAGVAFAAFVPLALLVGSSVAAVLGLVVYVLLVALIRPRGLRTSWSYLRALR
jgi:hypothetical protein